MKRLLIVSILIVAAQSLILCQTAAKKWAPDNKARLIDSGTQIREGFIQVTGGKVWYRIVGSGKAVPLLLLHGGPGFTSDYLKPLEALADERPVIFYDQLGGGRSDRPTDKNLWRIERFVKELGEVRRALGLKEVHILGHSWGTMLLTDYMLTHPKGVVSVVMAGPAISVKRWLGDANRLRAALPEDVQETLTRHEQAGTTNSDEYKKATDIYMQRHFCRLNPYPQELVNTFAKMGNEVYETMWGPSEFYSTGNLKDYERSSRLHEISVPTLFTCGRYDEATPEATAWYQSLVLGSKLAILENSAHLTMLEEPDRYVQIVRDFLTQVEHRSAQPSPNKKAPGEVN